MNCKAVRKWMSPYLDSELDRPITFEVSEHLQDCSECAARFDAERRVDDTIRSQIERATMPAELWARVKDEVSRDSWSGSRRRNRPS